MHIIDEVVYCTNFYFFGGGGGGWTVVTDEKLEIFNGLYVSMRAVSAYRERFHWGSSDSGVRLTTNLHLVPRLKIMWSCNSTTPIGRYGVCRDSTTF